MGLLESAVRFSLASTLFGAERLGDLLTPRTLRRLPRSLDALGLAAAAEMGEVSQMVFHTGVELSEEWLHMALGLAGGDAEARGALRRRGADTLRLARPDRQGALSRLEARHKLATFWQVRRARRALGTPRDGRPFPLGPYLEKALALGDGLSFWAVEGLGHDYVLAHLESTGREPDGLLRELPGRGDLDLGSGHLAALHAGLGLAVAEHLAGGLRPTDPLVRFSAGVERFAELCRRHATDSGQADVALETLGLVARVFFPPLFDKMALAAAERARLRRLFWHGAGRGFYFQGGQLMPGYGSLSRALEMARAATYHPADAEDALAGLGYAFLMVNRQAPELVAERLTATAAEIEDSGFLDGLAGALAMATLLEGPGTAEAVIDDISCTMDPGLWQRLVEAPYRSLRQQGPGHGLYGSLPWGRR